MLNVDVEEIPTGEFSVAGGYSTASGWMAELSVAERNLLGQGQYRQRRGAVRPIRPRLRSCRLPSRISWDNRAWRRRRSLRQADAGDELRFLQQQNRRRARTRAGFRAERRAHRSRLRYNIYSAENHAAVCVLNDCQFSPNALVNGGPGVSPLNECVTRLAVPGYPGCYAERRSLAGRASRSWQRARCWCRCSDTPWPTTPSTTTRTRPLASMPSSSRISPASAATSTSFAPPSIPAAYYEMFSESLPCCICRAATSRAGAAKTCACWIISRWARTWSAALHRPASDRAT